jgi:hypothetical protein
MSHWYRVEKYVYPGSEQARTHSAKKNYRGGKKMVFEPNGTTLR